MIRIFRKVRQCWSNRQLVFEHVLDGEILTSSLVVARKKQLGSLQHGRVMQPRMSVGGRILTRSSCSHDATRLALRQVCSMVGLRIPPLVYSRRLWHGDHRPGRCIILRRDGCSCSCRLVGRFENSFHHRPRLRLRRHKAMVILVRDARMALQQIAPSERCPTEADKWFLLGI